MGFQLNTHSMTPSVQHSIVESLEPWRSDTVRKLKEMDRASWREWVWGLPGSTTSQDRDVSLKWASWYELQTKLREVNRVTMLLARAKIGTFDKLVATGDGVWLPYCVLQKMVTGLLLDSYEVFFAVLGSVVRKQDRVTIGARVLQLSLLSFYTRVSKSEHLMAGISWPESNVPEEFQHQVEQFSPSKEGRRYRKVLVESLQGEFRVKQQTVKGRNHRRVFDSDEEHDPHALIQNISQVDNERLRIASRFIVKQGSWSPLK